MKKLSRLLCIALSVIMVSSFIAIAAACVKPGNDITITFEYATNNKSTITVKSGEKIPTASLPNDPTPATGKKFKFWSDDNSTDYVETKTPTADITLKPLFEDRNAGEFIVHFDSQGGTYVKTQVIMTGSKATKPTNPTKSDGSPFSSWKDTKSGSTFEFDSTNVTKDYYLQAIWEEGVGKTLVQSSGDFDGVFSPFFSTSAYDGSVIGDTQISMLSSDRDGNVYVGEDAPTVAKDYSQVTYVNGEATTNETTINQAVTAGLDSEDFYTEYQFVIKNGIKFSDGTDLTIKDVIYNLYTYLDPVYTGSSTMYSSNIVGLAAYRSQNPDADDKSGSDSTQNFQNRATTRRANLWKYFPSNRNYITQYRANIAATFYDDGRNAEQVLMEDLYYLRQLFWDELKADAVTAWSMTEVTKEGNVDGYEPGLIVGYEQYGFKYTATQDDRWKIYLLMNDKLTVEYTSQGKVKAWQASTDTGKSGYPAAVGDPWVVMNGTEIYQHWGQEDLIKIMFNDKMGLLSSDSSKGADYVGNYDSLAYLDDPSVGRPNVDLLFDDANQHLGSKYALRTIDELAIDKTDSTKFVNRVLDSNLSNAIYNNVVEVSYLWTCAGTLFNYMVANERSLFYLSLKDDDGNASLSVESIRGITVSQIGIGTGTTTFNSKDNGAQPYDDDTYDVLSIKIWGIDPKAIWNFSFAVAPMHYYSNPSGKGTDYNVNTHGYLGFKYPGIDGYTGTKIHPGFPQFDDVYFAKVMRANSVQGVPVGAGAFKATNSSGANVGLGVIQSSEFLSNNFVYLRRNEFFYTTGAAMSNVKFELMKYKVIESTKVIDELKNEDVHVGDPNAKQENINQLLAANNVSYLEMDNNGYGYVGVNARYVPDLEIRQAIMTAMNTSRIMDYYTGGLASLIYRPMSTVSWAYPKDATDATADVYPYVSEAAATEEIKTLVAAAGYSNSKMQNGAYAKTVEGGTRDLKFTFTIAGSSTDHPAHKMFLEAKELLNKCGFNITVDTSATALASLAAGTLEVWAAAWNTSIDPDMYQVYHKNSRATSTNNWGYRYLLDEGHATDTELGIINSLSARIDEARQSLDNSAGGTRAARYADALILVMNLAIEYPTYQRKNIVAYCSTKIDSSTLAENPSVYYGAFSEIWNVRLLK